MSIIIEPYVDTWPAEFQHLAQLLREALGTLALSIDHIGSTSVPGLAAKDVIDIQVTVASLQPEEPIITAITSTGLEWLPHIRSDHYPPGFGGPASEYEKLIFSAPSGARRVNLHVRVQGHANQRYAVLFRDYLRTHALAADAYAQVKLAVARLHPEDVEAYYDVKDPVCDIIMAGAQEWVAR